MTPVVTDNTGSDMVKSGLPRTGLHVACGTNVDPSDDRLTVVCKTVVYFTVITAGLGGTLRF